MFEGHRGQLPCQHALPAGGTAARRVLQPGSFRRGLKKLTHLPLYLIAGGQPGQADRAQRDQGTRQRVGGRGHAARHDAQGAGPADAGARLLMRRYMHYRSGTVLNRPPVAHKHCRFVAECGLLFPTAPTASPPHPQPSQRYPRPPLHGCAGAHHAGRGGDRGAEPLEGDGGAVGGLDGGRGGALQHDRHVPGGWVGGWVRGGGLC